MMVFKHPSLKYLKPLKPLLVFSFVLLRERIAEMWCRNFVGLVRCVVKNWVTMHGAKGEESKEINGGA